LLFHWFVGLGIDDAMWDHSVFSKNRDRLLMTEIAQDFLAALLADPKVKRLLSHEHFSVDGTLLKAWAFDEELPPQRWRQQPADRRSQWRARFQERVRSNETHESTTDPDARLHRKGHGRESKLCYMGHVLMENRNGLAVLREVTRASGTAERDAALDLIDRRGAGHRMSASAAASGSRRSSAGPRPPAAWPSSRCVAWRKPTASSPSA
jgi:hypothetical protein